VEVNLEELFDLLRMSMVLAHVFEREHAEELHAEPADRRQTQSGCCVARTFSKTRRTRPARVSQRHRLWIAGREVAQTTSIRGSRPTLTLSKTKSSDPDSPLRCPQQRLHALEDHAAGKTGKRAYSALGILVKERTRRRGGALL